MNRIISRPWRTLPTPPTLPTLGLLLTLIAGSPSMAHAEPPMLPVNPPPLPAGMSEPENAALLYGRALRLIPAQTLEHMAETDNETGKPTARAIEAIKTSGETLTLVRRAAMLESCHWGIEYQLGPYALLEHAGLMRRLVRALDNEAVVLSTTDIDRSVENVVAMLGIAEHMTQDRLVLSTLVSVAIAAVSQQRINAFLEAGLLEPAHTKLLLEAIDRVEATASFGVREALGTERWMASEWFRAIGVGPDAGPRVAHMLTMLSQDEDQAILDAITLMDERQLSHLFDEAAQAYDEILLAFDATDPHPELTRVSAAIEKGEFGLIARHFSASIGNIYASLKRITDSLEEVKARLQAIG